MQAHLLQPDTAWEDPAENFRRADALLASAPVSPGDLAVLPELFDTGFSFNLSVTTDTQGRTLDYLQRTAARLKITLVGSRSVMGPAGKAFNRCTIADASGKVICEYDKIHPFTFGRENEHYVGGDTVRTFRHEGTTICPTICYDLRFPELFRLGMLARAEVFTVIANWPAPRAFHRRALATARAIENQAIVLCVNRAGRDPHLSYEGCSFAIGPKGDTLAELGSAPGVLSVQLDLAQLHAWRAEFPAWRDVKLIGR
ncbi:MAG: nitrilase-related carbon-nitrogen hydrolase [Phycisphaerales bacterium]